MVLPKGRGLPKKQKFSQEINRFCQKVKVYPIKDKSFVKSQKFSQEVVEVLLRNRSLNKKNKEILLKCKILIWKNNGFAKK